MKITFLSAVILFSCYCASAQTNTFPTGGNVGIGTTNPLAPLDVNGAIAIKGTIVNDTQSISTTSDGTYVIASGPRIKGTYTLNFEAANRVQTVILLTNAIQFDYSSSISILSNISYGGSSNAVMSNFRYLFNADNSIVYLVFDIANRNTGTSVSAHFDGTGYYSANWSGTLPGSTTAAVSYPLVINEGNVSIGTVDSKGYRFAVNGNAIATAMTVKLQANWPDYVFKTDYRLPSLQEVKTYIDQNQHLPEMPTAAEVEKDGLNLGEMNKLLTKKVEELTLYLIEKDKKEKEQGQLNQDLKDRLDKLERKINHQ